MQESSQAASNFKDTMRGKLKRFLGLYKRDASDDELEKLCEDPEAAKKLMQEQVIGTAHSKV